MSFRLADEGNWSGGGRVFLDNFREAAAESPLLAGGTGRVVDLVPRNVPVAGLRQTRPFVLAPQNAWPWVPVSHGLHDRVRVASLRAASEVTLRRAYAVLRISSAIPIRTRGLWSRVIHNVLDARFEEDLAASLDERVAGAEGAIVAIGSINSYRGFDTLCQAHRHYLKRGGVARLLIAGTPSNAHLARTLVREFQASNVSIRLGSLTRSQCLAAYRDAALVVLPSYVEASPLTALEALAMTPRVLFSDIVGHREIVSRYGDVVTEGFVRPRDEASLAQALQRPGEEPFRAQHNVLCEPASRANARRHWADELTAWLVGVATVLEGRRR